MSDSRKHHFIPAFYLKQWAGGEGQLCQFSRPHVDLRARRVHPNATGFVPHLNTIPGLPEGQRSELEDKVMRLIDTKAAKALHLLLHGEPADFNVDVLSDWSRFIMSLIHRNPQKFAWFKEEARQFYSNNQTKIKATYDRIRTDADPPTYADYEARLTGSEAEIGAASVMAGVCDDPVIGNAINGMRWSVMQTQDVGANLLTSDRPVIMSNGLAYPGSFIILPIGPRSAFLAVRGEAEEAQFHEKPIAELVEVINHTIAWQARDYVWGADDGQIRFVDEQLGKGVPQFLGGGKPIYSKQRWDIE